MAASFSESPAAPKAGPTCDLCTSLRKERVARTGQVTAVPGLTTWGSLKQLAPPFLQNYKGYFGEAAHCRGCVLFSG